MGLSTRLKVGDKITALDGAAAVFLLSPYAPRDSKESRRVLIYTIATYLAIALGAGIVEGATESELVRAIAQVESSGRADARGDGGRAVGVLQIHPILVRDVNRIAGTSYTLADRLDPAKSAEMFLIYCRHYCGAFDAERWSRTWNGGPAGPSKRATLGYWSKVRAVLAKESQ